MGIVLTDTDFVEEPKKLIVTERNLAQNEREHFFAVVHELQLVAPVLMGLSIVGYPAPVTLASFLSQAEDIETSGRFVPKVVLHQLIAQAQQFLDLLVVGQTTDEADDSYIPSIEDLPHMTFLCQHTDDVDVSTLTAATAIAQEAYSEALVNARSYYDANRSNIESLPRHSLAWYQAQAQERLMSGDINLTERPEDMTVGRWLQLKAQLAFAQAVVEHNNVMRAIDAGASYHADTLGATRTALLRLVEQDDIWLD